MLSDIFSKAFCLKIDVDTERGTRVGVPILLDLLNELGIPATFFFSLGKDNTGRAIKRIFKKGFFSKVSRTSVVSVYGIRTLLNGLLLPGPHIGKLHESLMRKVEEAGFSVGIHCYDHVLWQDRVSQMSEEEIEAEFNKSTLEFERIFGKPAKTAAAPGWQTNERTLSVYDKASLVYASDCRGHEPFFPYVCGRNGRVFNTLQIPTTLPTLDELLGRPEFSILGKSLELQSITNHYFSLLKLDSLNVMTIHAELEGMKYAKWFKEFIIDLKKQEMRFFDLDEVARECLKNRDNIPRCEILQGLISGRSGALAVQSRH